MHWKGLKTSYGDEYTFFITPHGDEFKLSADPAWRRNGTQTFDGYFPRYFKKVSSAKSSLTKFLGKPDEWKEIED